MKNTIKTIIGVSLIAMTLSQAAHANSSSMSLLQQLASDTPQSQCKEPAYGICVAGCGIGIGRSACYASCSDRYCNG